MLEIDPFVFGFWPVVASVGASLVGGLFQKSANDKANSIAQNNANQSREIVQQAYEQNQGLINSGYDRAQGYVIDGAQGAESELRGYADDGQQAWDRYNQAAGLDGEAQRQRYVDDIMRRPEFEAARSKALREVQARYGAAGKGGSGAFYRGLQRTDLENSQSYIDRDMARLRPTMSQGALASQQIGSMKLNTGTALSSTEIGRTNSLVNNNNNFASSNININSGAASSASQNAQANGQLIGGAFNSLGKALGSFAGNAFS